MYAKERTLVMNIVINKEFKTILCFLNQLATLSIIFIPHFVLHIIKGPSIDKFFLFFRITKAKSSKNTTEIKFSIVLKSTKSNSTKIYEYLFMEELKFP